MFCAGAPPAPICRPIRITVALAAPFAHRAQSAYRADVRALRDGSHARGFASTRRTTRALADLAAITVARKQFARTASALAWGRTKRPALRLAVSIRKLISTTVGVAITSVLIPAQMERAFNRLGRGTKMSPMSCTRTRVSVLLAAPWYGNHDACAG